MAHQQRHQPLQKNPPRRTRCRWPIPFDRRSRNSWPDTVRKCFREIGFSVECRAYIHPLADGSGSGRPPGRLGCGGPGVCLYVPSPAPPGTANSHPTNEPRNTRRSKPLSVPTDGDADFYMYSVCGEAVLCHSRGPRSCGIDDSPG